MNELLRKVSIFLSERSHSIYAFLKENDFFKEMTKGVVKLIFFIIVLSYFKQVVW